MLYPGDNDPSAAPIRDSMARASPLEDLRTRIVDHPWQAVGGAFLLGAWFAREQPRLPTNRLARTALAMIGAVVVRVGREVAQRELLALARAWVAPEREPFATS